MFEVERAKEDIIQWIKEQMQENGGTTAVLGISGGKDSTVVAALCVEALGKENVVGVLMPNGNQHDIDCSKEVVNHLGIKSYTVNIQEMYTAEVYHLTKALHGALTEEAKINIAPRIRMTTLYAIAQSLRGGRVVGTGNLSERYIGYFTKYGDGGCDFNPIGNLVVAEVKSLGYSLGIPKHLIDKTPEDGLSGKTDEEKIGFSYDTLDKYIRTYVCEDKETKDKIDKMHNYSGHKNDMPPLYKLFKY